MVEIRASILAALGLLAIGCGPTLGTPANSGGNDGDSGEPTGDDDGVDGTSLVDSADVDSDESSGDTAMPADCEPILQAGPGATIETGFYRCAGVTMRVFAAECEQPEPVGEACTLDDQPCATDDDCTERPHGRCVQASEIQGDGEYCGCRYGCATDDDCEADQLCACAGDAPGYPGQSACIVAGCSINNACTTGVCALGELNDGCGSSYRAACQTEADTCQANADCGDVETCWPDNATGAWGCENFCCCGRPLLVDGEARVAGLVPRADWANASRADVAELSDAQRRVLAKHWGEAAAMEHASVASFARFAVELMAVGAPPQLLAAASEAMGDELDHAQRCYALASSYGATTLGPAPLDVSEINFGTRLETIVRAVVDEACIGETLAAVEARAALAGATDPAVREALQVIAADELRHAELGWRVLRWALEGCTGVTRARLRTYVTKAVVDARRKIPVGDDLGDPALRRHGKLAPADRTRVLRNALDTVVAPCVSALLEQLPRSA